MRCGMVQDARRFCEWYVPEAVFISAPLENGWEFACDGDVIVVMNCGSIFDFLKIGNVSIVGKGSNAQERVGGECR